MVELTKQADGTLLGPPTYTKLTFPPAPDPFIFHFGRAFPPTTESRHWQVSECGGTSTEGNILCLVIQRPDGTWRFEDLGSAVMVAPGIALTAAHCLQGRQPGDRGFCVGHYGDVSIVWQINVSGIACRARTWQFFH